MLGSDDLPRHRDEFTRRGVLQDGHSSSNLQDRFTGEKIYQVIDICTNTVSAEFDDECPVLQTLRRTIDLIRGHECYTSLQEWTSKVIDLRQGMRTLSSVLFEGRSVTREQRCYRALTLYVYVYDLCQTIRDNDVKRDILNIIESVVIRHDVDWTLSIMFNISKCPDVIIY